MALPNSSTVSEFPVEYLEALDEVLVNESFSSRFEVQGAEFVGKKTVKYPKLTFSDGLVDYDGFATKTGSTLEFETRELDKDKQAVFEVDAVEDINTAHIQSTNLNAQFLRVKAIPEMDTDFFAKVAGNAGFNYSNVINKDTIKGELRKARKALGNAGVSAGISLYMSWDAYLFLEEATDAKRMWTSESNINDQISVFDGMPVFVVPDDRIGDIDFALIADGSMRSIKKRQVTYLFAPGTHTQGDNWLSQSRWVYGSFALDNAKNGIYVNVNPRHGCALTSFKAGTFTGTINETAGTIAVSAPAGSTITGLVITWDGSPEMTLKQGSTAIVSGTTAIDFVSGTAKNFKAIAEDASTEKTYAVTVTVAS